MVISLIKSSGFLVFDVEEPVTLHGRIDQLLVEIRRAIERGERLVAVRFTKDSFLYSSGVRILVQCVEAVRDAGGKFALVEPNKDILEAVYTLSLDSYIRILPSGFDVKNHDQHR